MNAERERLERRRLKQESWARWGPYLSERQWGTVREDYSPYGTAWDYFPHDHARSRAYRWGEDGIGGICDEHQLLCFAIACWNGNDPILKERLFGLTNGEGNHGEDVKEYYFYLDNVPSHAYMKMLYRYPHGAFPYSQLLDENRRRTRADPEYELIDTGIFEDDRFFDVTIEYAKVAPDDIAAIVTVANHGPDRATIHVLPTLWFRNTWSWRHGSYKPVLRREESRVPNVDLIVARHQRLGDMRLYCDSGELLFTENETNYRRLFGSDNAGPYVKDGIGEYVVGGRRDAVNWAGEGTKAAARYALELAPHASHRVRLRLTASTIDGDPFATFDELFERRRGEADEFYDSVISMPVDDDRRAIARQAFAGILWSKQFYYYVVQEWLDGDPAMPAPPPQRRSGRNCAWAFLHAADVLSMPDTWEYPWFAEWDLAFHCVVLALLDPEYAKKQMDLLAREWYMHPSGELPAYEWAFGDVNPPLWAWAARRVYQIDARLTGSADALFLERIFQRLLLTFTWWVNRKDADGNNIFQGGFLGLDNIGPIDRDAVPAGTRIDQSDGTSWMAVFSGNMLAIALELAGTMPAYEDIAGKFFAHFLYIAKAINEIGGDGLWDEADGFYYDFLRVAGQPPTPLRVRSLVGLVPLVASEVSEGDVLERLPAFAKQVRWFVRHRPDLTESIAYMERGGIAQRYLLALADSDKLLRILARMLAPGEFLGPAGIRSLSRIHLQDPFQVDVDGIVHRITYEPAESTSSTFGGNSNWRGPVWFPMNFLLIEALQKLHYYYGDDFKVEMPAGSGFYSTLWEVASDLSDRLISIFARDRSGRRPVFGGNHVFQTNPLWRDLIPFYEYFNGDDGEGLGASHQTGWTALVGKLILQHGEYAVGGKRPLDGA